MSGNSQINQTAVVANTKTNSTPNKIASTANTKLPPESKADPVSSTNNNNQEYKETQHPPSTKTQETPDTNIIDSIIYGCKEKGAKAYQEDSYCIFTSPDLTLMVAGIFDGHGGINGQVASQTVKRLCFNYFEKHWKMCKLWSNEEWKQNMCLMFEDFHFQVRQEFISVVFRNSFHFCTKTNMHFNLYTVGNRAKKNKLFEYEQYC